MWMRSSRMVRASSGTVESEADEAVLNSVHKKKKSKKYRLKKIMCKLKNSLQYFMTS
jgi:hypothetical protein